MPRPPRPTLELTPAHGVPALACLHQFLLESSQRRDRGRGDPGEPRAARQPEEAAQVLGAREGQQDLARGCGVQRDLPALPAGRHHGAGGHLGDVGEHGIAHQGERGSLAGLGGQVSQHGVRGPHEGISAGLAGQVDEAEAQGVSVVLPGREPAVVGARELSRFSRSSCGSGPRSRPGRWPMRRSRWPRRRPSGVPLRARSTGCWMSAGGHLLHLVHSVAYCSPWENPSGRH